jgi:hypothetical protein
MRRYLCGAPPQHCSGNGTFPSAGLGKSIKAHVSSVDAFKCYSRYLVNVEGYERIGGREFLKKGEGVLVLTKQSRFGAELRPGKSNEKSNKAARFMPKSGGGVIV